MILNNADGATYPVLTNAVWTPQATLAPRPTRLLADGVKGTSQSLELEIGELTGRKS